MAKFEYRARNEKGKVLVGQLEAASEDAAASL